MIEADQTTSLLRAQRFLPLFATQALGALNDNLFKNALVVLIAVQSADGAPSLIAIAGGLFILPYVLFSALAGQLADRFAKPRLIRLTKLAEVAVMAGAAGGLLTGSIPLMLLVLTALGVQATFFGPLKYGLLPEHLRARELLRGNALIEAGTFAAILAGTIAGGVLIGLPSGALVVAAAGLALALLGLLASGFVPPSPPAAPTLPIRLGPAETVSLLREARRDQTVWRSILGVSWFWALGATFLAEFPVIAKRDFHGDNQVITLLLAAFVVGVAAGSMLAGRLTRGEVSARHVPAAATLLSGFTFGFAVLAATAAAGSWTTPAAMLASASGLAALACLVGAAACGGVFSVPLYALIQQRAASAERARMVAANNVLNAVFMVAAAGAIALLAALGANPSGVLTIAGALNLLAAALLRRTDAIRPAVAG